MKDKEVVNVSIEYGKESLKQIILKLLKEEYINYITINENKCLFRADKFLGTRYNKFVL